MRKLRNLHMENSPFWEKNWRLSILLNLIAPGERIKQIDPDYPFFHSLVFAHSKLMISASFIGHPKACYSPHSFSFYFVDQNRTVPGASLQLSCAHSAPPQCSEHSICFLSAEAFPSLSHSSSETSVHKKAEATAHISLLQSAS